MTARRVLLGLLAVLTTAVLAIVTEVIVAQVRCVVLPSKTGHLI